MCPGRSVMAARPTSRLISPEDYESTRPTGTLSMSYVHKRDADSRRQAQADRVFARITDDDVGQRQCPALISSRMREGRPKPRRHVPACVSDVAGRSRVKTFRISAKAW